MLSRANRLTGTNFAMPTVLNTSARLSEKRMRNTTERQRQDARLATSGMELELIQRWLKGLPPEWAKELAQALAVRDARVLASFQAAFRDWRGLINKD